MTEEKGSVLIYQSEDGSIALDVTLERDTVWLSQAQMCDLFGRDQSVISRHIRNVFREGELGEQSNMQKMHIAGSDKPVSYFSLDVIISGGLGHIPTGHPLPHLGHLGFTGLSCQRLCLERATATGTRSATATHGDGRRPSITLGTLLMMRSSKSPHALCKKAAPVA